jgi:hypothetical protein
MRDTIDMAREAGAMIYNSPHDPKKLIDIMFTPEHLKAFEALVRADEKEACAKVAETYREWDDTGMGISTAIRERSANAGARGDI